MKKKINKYMMLRLLTQLILLILSHRETQTIIKNSMKERDNNNIKSRMKEKEYNKIMKSNKWSNRYKQNIVRRACTVLICKGE